MIIDWQNFTPYSALLGGALIGLAASLFAVLLGRVAGISGVLGGLLQKQNYQTLGDYGWRIAFLMGLLLAPALYSLFATYPTVQWEAGPLGLIIAGLLVGVGTRYGSGCTSGHGICGLSRLSPRSLVAVLCFMAAGFVTVFVLRHIMG